MPHRTTGNMLQHFLAIVLQLFQTGLTYSDIVLGEFDRFQPAAGAFSFLDGETLETWPILSIQPSWRQKRQSDCPLGGHLNQCGVCVGGETGRSENTGKDACGVCWGQSKCLGCDGIMNSGAQIDQCGLCRIPGSPSWNSCTRLTVFSKSVLDLAVGGPTAQIDIDVDMLSTAQFVRADCVLNGQGGAQTFVTQSSIVGDKIKMNLTKPMVGNYLVKCTLFPPIGDEVSVTFQDEPIKVVDSNSMLLTDIDPKQALVGKTVEVILTGANIPNNAVCFVWEPNSATANVLHPIAIQPNQIDCGPYVGHRAKRVAFGILASEQSARQMTRADNRPVKFLEIMAPPPSVRGVFISDDHRQMLVVFNSSVEAVSNRFKACNLIFDGQTMSHLGSGATCAIRNEQIIVTLGPDNSVAVGTPITFNPQNGIHTAGVFPQLALKARGTYTVQNMPIRQQSTPPTVMTIPTVPTPPTGPTPPTPPGTLPPKVIQAITTACDRSGFVRLALRDLIISNDPSLVITWDVRSVDLGPFISQRTTLRMWRSIRALENHMRQVGKPRNVISFSGELMETDVVYKITVTATNPTTKAVVEKKELHLRRYNTDQLYVEAAYIDSDPNKTPPPGERFCRPMFCNIRPTNMLLKEDPKTVELSDLPPSGESGPRRKRQAKYPYPCLSKPVSSYTGADRVRNN